MRFFITAAFVVLCLFTSGCGSTDDAIPVDYDNPNLTGGLYFAPDRLVISDNTTKSFSFTYNNETMLLVGLDTTSTDSVYDVAFKMDSCLAAVSIGGGCVIDVKFKDPAYVCTDTADKYIVLKFRYLYDFGTGYVKDQILPVRCKAN